MQKETQLSRASWYSQGINQAATINPPRYRGSTVLFDNYAQMLNPKRAGAEKIVYGTDRLPTQRQFEEAMRELEGGSLTRVFQSGIAAIQAVLMAFTRAGDHILVVDNAYGPGQRFCRDVLHKFGVDHTLIPPDVGADIEQYIRPNTSLILLESPGSISFELQDIPAVTEIARLKKIITVLDCTWATPLYFKPFEQGIDLSLHSVTKYICGHSDILAGSVTANEKYARELDLFYNKMEFYTPAEECYLALRGLPTLAVRMQQHQDSALTIASYLEAHPLVDRVLHPALPSHPEHHIWKRDFSGASGLFAFTLKKEYSLEQLSSFIDSLQLFGLGYSWGGYKSLLTASKLRRNTPCRYDGQTLIRLNIGLENCQDLLEDIENGLRKLTL